VGYTCGDGCLGSCMPCTSIVCVWVYIGVHVHVHRCSCTLLFVVCQMCVLCFHIHSVFHVCVCVGDANRHSGAVPRLWSAMEHLVPQELSKNCTVRFVLCRFLLLLLLLLLLLPLLPLCVARVCACSTVSSEVLCVRH